MQFQLVLKSMQLSVDEQVEANIGSSTSFTPLCLLLEQ
jgi:hypothetical protein